MLSRFTAFVAVDQRVVDESGELHRVTQPVELPDGWAVPGGGAYGGGGYGAPAPAFGAVPDAMPLAGAPMPASAPM
ncbi:hypothetical protein K7G98_17150, partial [Saccharothrix sp. MB29]|nr:hypothetical protein [Saccharothrix sp. MB29]